MHTLYPPLDDSSSFYTIITTNTTDNNRDMKKDDNVLSPELRQNFESMKALKRKDPPTMDAADEAHEAKKLQLAIKTAMAMELEMERMRNGIAELEALLEEAEGTTGDITGFPFLPPIVPADEDSLPEDDDVTGSDSLSSEATGEMVHG